MPQLSTPMIHEVLNDVVACLDRKVKSQNPDALTTSHGSKLLAGLIAYLGGNS